MKSLRFLLLSLALGVAAFAIFRHFAMREMHDLASLPEVEWVVHEFALDDARAGKVRALHAAFGPQCEGMCRRIGAANARLDALLTKERAMSPELQAALRESAEVSAECRAHTLGHIYAVAAEMPPEQAARYLALMKPRILRPGVPHPAIAGQAAHEGHR